MNENESPLVGKWFHSFETENNDTFVEWQGLVLGALPNNKFLVGLFSWLDGEMNKQIIVDFKEMLSWHFYDSSEQMKDVYENLYKIKAEERAIRKRILTTGKQ